MLFPVIAALSLATVQAQTVDPSLLIDIFGTPPTVTRPTNLPPRLEDITVRPTASGTTFTNNDGDDCQCLPYYLCDDQLRAIHKSNASVTGWGLLDVRFGGDKTCQESVERCCKDADVVPEPPVVEPQPDALKPCGYRNPNGLDFQITGGDGNEAQFGEFPWVVAIMASNYTYLGVGVLIHPQVVLTGAHIVAKYGPGSLIARAGEWDTQTDKERFKYQERVVDAVRLRNDFNPKNVQNDVALLHLQSPYQLDQHINLLCLPAQDEDFDQYRGCVANGWGRSSFGRKNRYAVILKKVEVDMVPFDRCNYLLRQTRLGQRFRLHPSFVCAGGEEGKDTCQGDGGAPLACPVGNDRYKLAGLVAWGIGCGQKDVPAVYVRVSMFRNWIDDGMRNWGFNADSYTLLN